MPSAYRVAAVQAEPVWLDIDATVDKTVELIADAADQGAALVAFPETWIPGYPLFLWLGPVAGQMPYIARYHANSMTTEGKHLTAIRQAARRHDISVAIGYSEKDHGSLYMSQSIIGPDGEVLLHRRKLKPTHVERSLFGESDGSHLKVVDTHLGRLGALNCWEHLQPLNKYAMYAQHEQVHIACWPAFGLYKGIAYSLGAEANMAATQTYALEGSCFVVAPTQVLSAEGVEIFASTDEQRALLTPGSGSSRIFGPDGSSLGKPLDEHAEGLVLADIDLAFIDLAKNAADPAGHYAKPDATRLLHDNRPKSAVVTPGGPVGPLFPELDPLDGDLADDAAAIVG
ncbi:carbon-nitrogen hydrolase family protein [Streptomyces neyagawaensis]|uniref:carbon-nitrogen hydrolase family protein n=1 Tax=Streptomyces neyagawaensis TaxID=42238 RepID=UPI0006E1A471|nr:carbon-nitrogen hydrolase family protein [Streptomyces neyagawaensis]MCL6737476.1 carbon-nitrogen hydrolase family protein [Streptomyces neyagawaensis]MDE1688239.1 carbon-nitrogen hydrolase family protein [Streptomyces neyagawaensis]